MYSSQAARFKKLVDDCLAAVSARAAAGWVDSQLDMTLGAVRLAAALLQPSAAAGSTARRSASLQELTTLRGQVAEVVQSAASALGRSSRGKALLAELNNLLGEGTAMVAAT